MNSFVLPDEPVTLRNFGLVRFDAGRRQAEVACRFDPDADWATAAAAVQAAARWAFEHDVQRLEWLVAKHDTVSLRAALGAGFRIEGVRRGAATDITDVGEGLVVFARLADDPPGPTVRQLPDLPGGRLTDGVVQVRPLGPADVADYLALNQEPDVAGSHFGDPVTAESAGQRCWHAQYRWLSGELADCVIAESSTGAFAGTVQLVYREPGTRTGMLGYALLPAFRGRGFATRAVRLVADWADTIGLARLIAGTTPDNTGSRAVLLRAGFEFEALCKAALPARDGTWLDNVQFVRRCLRAKETS